VIGRNTDTVRAVAWSEVCPWLCLVRIFRISITVRALFLGALAVLLTVSGWAVVGTIFSPTNSMTTPWLAPHDGCPWKAVTQAIPDRPDFSGIPGVPGHPERKTFVRQYSNPMQNVWTMLSQPAWHGLVDTNQPVRNVAYLLLCGLWSVAIWSFLGAAICRTAVVRLAVNERIGWGAALRFAGRKWPAYFAAPLFPLGGVLLAMIPIFLLGLLMSTSVGMLVGGIFWPLALIAGFLMTLLLLGLLFGWPLMWGTISTEGTDSFDALSRSYAYVFQRPLHYLFYLAIASLIGWLGWLLVRNFAAGIVWMSYWAAGWGCGGGTIFGVIDGREGLGVLTGVGAGMIRFWAGCVKLLAVGYLFSYFWTASTAIYLLLRHDVDATEMDEVFLDADAAESASDLPAVATSRVDEPTVENNIAETPSDETTTNQ